MSSIENGWDAFREEAYELLAELESSLLDLEESPDDNELVRRVFRALHTIKGAGSMSGFDEIADFVHEIEAVFDMVRSGELCAPVVIGRDHLDSGSVASPNRETESMRDGSDAVSDWPMLNALLNCASGATWVSLHHGRFIY